MTTQLNIIDQSGHQPVETTSIVSDVPVKGTYSFVSLGCPKNLVDSERMLGLLQLDGYQLKHDPVGTDFVVVNTCGFIEEARNESRATIEEMLELKRRGDIRGVIVSGCFAERAREVLLEELPEIDSIVGVFGRDEVTRVADRLLGGLNEQRMVFNPAPTHTLSDRNRLRITPRHFGYLKISEGCDRLCTFCAIPKMRGKHVSKPIEEVLAEARELAEDGVRELIIVAQDTTYYGKDLYGEPRLAELLAELEKVDGIDWIRLLYFYPMYVTPQVIEQIASSERIVPYLDMPLQHINDTVLKRMQRRVNRADTEALLDTLRREIPDLVLRTTFITGFPGETDAQFEELADFVRQQRFERVGVFTYSHEADTPAVRLDGHLPDDVKESRRDALMQVQQEIAFDWNAQQVGRQFDVIIDAAIPDEPTAWVGRTYADTPDIDNSVFVSGDNLGVGRIVRSEIVAVDGYDLVAAAVGQAR
jgi:ribosomal protein S12 methylthiotransferase